MSSRSFNAPSYKYGMNGQEKDDEVFEGAMTAEYWEYDSRLGRRWNVDPVSKHWESPYACFHNNPILYVDINGDDPNGPVTKATLESSKNQDKISATTTSETTKVSKVEAGTTQYNILANKTAISTPQGVQINGIKLKETTTTTIRTETIINYDDNGKVLNTSSNSTAITTKRTEAFIDYSYVQGSYNTSSSQPFQVSLGGTSSSSSESVSGKFTNDINTFATILVNYRANTGSSFTNWSGVENQLQSQNNLVQAFQEYGYVSKAMMAGSIVNSFLIKPILAPKPVFGPALVVSAWVFVLGKSAERGRQILQGRQDAKSCNNCKESYFIQGANVGHK